MRYRYGELKQQLELKQSEAQHSEDKLKQSTHGQQLEEIEQLQQSIGTLAPQSLREFVVRLDGCAFKHKYLLRGASICTCVLRIMQEYTSKSCNCACIAHRHHYTQEDCFVSVDSEELLAQAREVKATAQRKVKALEDKLKNAQAVRERELKEAEQGVTRAKKTLDNSKKQTKAKEQVRAQLFADSLMRHFRACYRQALAC